MSGHSSDPVRDQQLAKIVGNELSLILGAAADGRLQSLEIIRVEPKPGGRHFLIVYGPPSLVSAESSGLHGSADARELLAKAYGYVRSELASALNLKFAPELTFAPDPVRWAEWER